MIQDDFNLFVSAVIKEVARACEIPEKLLKQEYLKGRDKTWDIIVNHSMNSARRKEKYND